MSRKFLYLALAALVYASPLESRNNFCAPCRRQGATTSNPATIRTDLSSLYTNILRSVKDIRFQYRSSAKARDQGLCCRETLDCVNVQSLNVPMCYDKFTTNFAFADGSYGSLTTGEYCSSGDSANLISGEFTASGQIGNIYAKSPGEKPNTATLSLPPQYTAAGIGSAIPANQMGSVVVYTTTVSAVTYSARITVLSFVVVNTVSGQTVSNTMSGTTFTQPTPIAAQTSVVTTMQILEVSSTAEAAGAASAASAASSPGAAERVAVDVKAMSVLGALAYVLYALWDREL
jgi:hypothetical protein